MRNLIAATALSLSLSMAGTALAQSASASDEGTNANGAIRAMEQLPFPIFSAVLPSNSDEIVFMSGNGRFVIKGKLYDVWQGKSLTSLEEIKDSASRLDISKLNMTWADLAPYTIGKGKKEVVVFVDPRCPHCATVMKQIPDLEKDYTFKLIALPVLGEDSQKLVKSLHCAKDQKAAQEALLAKNASKMAELEQVAECALAPVQQRLVAAQMFGIRGVPFIVTPDKRVIRGAPTDLKKVLEAYN